MKKSIFSIFSLILLFSSCAPHGFNSAIMEKIEIIEFQCERHGEQYTDKNQIIILNVDDLQRCFLQSDKKTWLIMYYQFCHSTAKEEIELWKKSHSDEFELVVLVGHSFLYDEVYEEQIEFDFPMYYIDPSYSKWLDANSKKYVRTLNTGSKDAERSSHLIFDGEELVFCGYDYQINDSLLKRLSSSKR